MEHRLYTDKIRYLVGELSSLELGERLQSFSTISFLISRVLKAHPDNGYIGEKAVIIESALERMVGLVNEHADGGDLDKVYGALEDLEKNLDNS